MQRATFKAKASFCWSPRVPAPPPPPLGTRCLQTSLAAAEVCFETPVWNGGKFPWVSGSGKFDTPCERMQREKPSAAFSYAD